MTDPHTAPAGYRVDTASIDWSSGIPRSRDYGDIYWGGADVVAEKSHVFANQHDLARRGREADEFTLVEIGFGFGNNFLLTAQLWRDHHCTARLHYIAIERQPVSRTDLERHLKPFGSAEAAWLRANYPLPLRTRFHFWVTERVRLTLVFDDAMAALGDLDTVVDAWYLDGFSPASNPDAWLPALASRMAMRSRRGATLSTYSVAGDVRRALAGAAFTTQKVPGFGRKAEMLVASVAGEWQGLREAGGRVAVLGAGIAGQSVKAGLARRGRDAVTISDGPGASHLPAMTMFAQLTASPQHRSRFSIAAASYARHHLPGLTPVPVQFRSADDTRASRMADIALQLPDAYLETRPDGYRFGDSGLVQLDHRADLEATVGRISRTGSTWRLEDRAGRVVIEADQVVIATGDRSTAWLPVPLVPIRGQLLVIRTGLPRTQVTTGDVSLLPFTDAAGNDRFVLGSTYGVRDGDGEVRESDTDDLLARFRAACGDVPVEVVSAHTGVRLATRDRLPVAGAVPDWDALDAHVRRHAQLPFTRFQEGLFVLAALGSRGATHAPLAGDHVAALMCSGNGVLSQPEAAMLSAARFHLRDGRRANTADASAAGSRVSRTSRRTRGR